MWPRSEVHADCTNLTFQYAGSKWALIRLYEIMAAEYPDTHFVTYHPGVGELLCVTSHYRTELTPTIVETDMNFKSGMEGKPRLKRTREHRTSVQGIPGTVLTGNRFSPVAGPFHGLAREP